MDPTLLPNLDSSSHRLERPKFEVTFHDINMMTDTQISLSGNMCFIITVIWWLFSAKKVSFVEFFSPFNFFLKKCPCVA